MTRRAQPKGWPRRCWAGGYRSSRYAWAPADRWWRRPGEVFTVPAVPTNVVDTTGAGDAYCGGFLVALGSGVDAAEAGARAAVSASFALEQFGVPVFDDDAD